MTRRRALLLSLAVVGLALLGWLAIWGLTNTRLDLRSEPGDGGAVSFVTDFPAATCRKSFSADFPFVRFTCEPRGEPSAP